MIMKLIIILFILSQCFSFRIKKSMSKHKSKKNNQINDYAIFDVANQVKILGPYGMYADLSTPLRMQDGYLVPDDEDHLPHEYLAVRDQLLWSGAKKISARPVEVGDNYGNWAKIFP